ncbi:cytochrome P450 [Hyphomonas sediminis]|uniref:cytochrome P450 n=1 Tax=Hyphomonas sediminis TaxID=2866160 RepID=UPI001CECD0FE|nr:cytochrome P450 [Hyphomonas sediminis]
MAADTVSFVNHPALQRPKVTEREPLHPHNMRYGADIPPASEIDLSTLDLIDGELWRQGKYWDRFARLRKEDPLHYCPDSFPGPFWSVTRYEDVMAIDTDHKRFSSSWEYGGITLGEPFSDFELPMFIAMDEPRHSEQRKTVQPAVAPDMLKIYEPLIRSRTQEILDSLPVNEPFDWVDKVSIELTTMMLATLFDYPFEKRRDLTHWSDVSTGMHNPDICPGGEEEWRATMMECLMAFMTIFQERKQQPIKHDLISLLAHGEKTKDMTPQELLGNVILLIVGGNDTTRNSMTASVYALNKYPKEYEKLKANPAIIPNMVSETIRWQTPLAYMRRTALEDVEMHGKTIKKGDQVAMWYVSANRDESFWENPNDYIIDRPDARRHISFGFGIHRCVGNRLGEMQLRILWEELMARFEHIEVLAEPSLTQNAFVKGYTWMPVVLHPK